MIEYVPCAKVLLFRQSLGTAIVNIDSVSKLRHYNGKDGPSAAMLKQTMQR